MNISKYNFHESDLIKMFKFHIIFFITSLVLSNTEARASESTRQIEENKVINIVKQAKTYIQQYGKDEAIKKFKMNSSMIFAIDFDGNVLASPIHPETVGTNQIQFKDPSGILVVKEEIDKAIAGGGWLNGRYRKNHQTSQYECRRLYILPIKGNYFIGSWYYYTASKEGKCLV